MVVLHEINEQIAKRLVRLAMIVGGKTNASLASKKELVRHIKGLTKTGTLGAVASIAREAMDNGGAQQAALNECISDAIDATYSRNGWEYHFGICIRGRGKSPVSALAVAPAFFTFLNSSLGRLGNSVLHANNGCVSQCKFSGSKQQYAILTFSVRYSHERTTTAEPRILSLEGQRELRKCCAIALEAAGLYKDFTVASANTLSECLKDMHELASTEGLLEDDPFAEKLRCGIGLDRPNDARWVAEASMRSECGLQTYGLELNVERVVNSALAIGEERRAKLVGSPRTKGKRGSM